MADPTPSFSPPESFRRRALAEAARYGSDAWVFVRELLQNARDAGARRVELTAAEDGGVARVVCRDDGCGMSFEHARQFLFALYSSSKEQSRAEAGKFGIGFWSVLRFAPHTLRIRSHGRDGKGWQVELDGQLERVDVTAADLAGGTEIVLERPADATDLAAKLHRAARRYGRFLSCRDAPDEPLVVTVDGQPINAAFALPRPCAVFRGRGFRGVVGLGRRPRVELFAHGLFVRAAASIQDLREDAAGGHAATAEDALAELPSLAPQLLLDSSELDLLLARSDARHSRHLERMLKAADQQLARLVTRQLQALRPQPWHRLWLGSVRDRLAAVPRPRALAAAACLVLLLGGALGWRWLHGWQDAGRADRAQNGIVTTVAIQPAVAGGSAFHRYSDLTLRYRGPEPGPASASDAGRLGSAETTLALSYQPAGQMLLFTSLLVARLDTAIWAPTPVPASPPPYEGSVCVRECVDVELLLAPTTGTLQIPIPTGHRLDVGSLRLDDEPTPAYEGTNGEAVLRFAAPRPTLLEYRTGPAPAPRRADPQDPASTVEPLPDDLAAVAAQLRTLPLHQRVQEGLVHVARRVRYNRSFEPARRFAELRRAGAGFVASALAVGEGDCDVQNGLLVTLLRHAGVEARLALGYVGINGVAAPGLHAWVEYGDGQGGWFVADASTAGGSADAPSVLAAAPLQLPAAAGNAGAAPAPAAAQAAANRRLVSLGLAAAYLATALGVTVLVFRRRSARGEIALDPAGDLAALLGGALRHPGAFASLPAVSHGRFVPLLGSPRAISLAQARRLAARRRLFRSSLGSPLARRAATAGATVIDASLAEGRVSSLAIGAVDLDRWSRLLDQSRESTLTRHADRTLRQLGERWRIREVDGLERPAVEIDLAGLGLGRRTVLVDLAHPELAAAGERRAAHPAVAVLTLLDLLLPHLDLAPEDRDRILAATAERALVEAHG